MAYQSPGGGDPLTDAAKKHPALRIIIGFLLLFITWTLYLLLYPMFAVVLQSLANIVPLLNMTTAQIAATYSYYQTLSLMVGGAFVVVFTGIILAFIILPCFQNEGSFGY